MEVSGVVLSWMSWKLIVAVAVMLILIYDWWCHQYFQRRGIPVAFYLPIVGSLPIFSKGMGCRFVKFQKKYGKVFGWYFFRNPILAVTDVELLKEIMVKHFSHFTDRRKFIRTGKPLNNGLLSLKGEAWKNVRSVVTPAFSAVKMKQMSPMINQCCDVLLENLKKAETEGRPANCKELYGGFSMDTIAWCGFGLRVDSQKNKDDEFVSTAKKAFEFQRGVMFIAALLPFMWPIFKFFDVAVMSREVRGFFSKVTEEAGRIRKVHQEVGANGGNKHIDMLQLMLNAHNEMTDDVDGEAGPQLKGKWKKRALTQDDVTAQGITFFIAGYETTSTLLGYASYLLAINQDCQEKLYSEILDAVPSRDLVGYDSVNKLTYLDMVISETLRIYPPASAVFRVCTETFSNNDLTINKGDEVLINIYSIHHDKKHWPDPEMFDPERFSPERKCAIQPCTYIPFGYGPRNCIGMRFALLEAKMALVRVLQQYRLDVCKETQIPLQLHYGMLSAPKKNIMLRPVLRK